MGKEKETTAQNAEQIDKKKPVSSPAILAAVAILKDYDSPTADQQAITAALETVTAQLMNYIIYLVRRYTIPDHTEDDLKQLISLWILDAAKRFDPNHFGNNKANFAAFCSWRIRTNLYTLCAQQIYSKKGKFNRQMESLDQFFTTEDNSGVWNSFSHYEMSYLSNPSKEDDYDRREATQMIITELYKKLSPLEQSILKEVVKGGGISCYSGGPDYLDYCLSLPPKYRKNKSDKQLAKLADNARIRIRRKALRLIKSNPIAAELLGDLINL